MASAAAPSTPAVKEKKAVRALTAFAIIYDYQLYAQTDHFTSLTLELALHHGGCFFIFKAFRLGVNGSLHPFPATGQNVSNVGMYVLVIKESPLAQTVCLSSPCCYRL